MEGGEWSYTNEQTVCPGVNGTVPNATQYNDTCWMYNQTTLYNNKSWVFQSPIGNYSHNEHYTPICSYDNPLEKTIVTDNCIGTLNVSFAEQVLNYNSHFDFGVRRTWTAHDICGNTGVGVQNYNFYDGDKPVINYTANIYLPCTGSLTPNYTVEDCDADYFTSITPTVLSSGCSYLTKTSYAITATDHNGATDTVYSIVEQADVDVPQINITQTWYVVDCYVTVDPVDTYHDCSPSLIVSNLDDVYLKSDPTWPGLASLINTWEYLLPDNYTKDNYTDHPAFENVTEAYIMSVTIRQYSTTQDCEGNSAPVVYDIIFEIDDERPSLIGVPAGPIDVQCFEDIPPDTANVFMFDNCVTAPVVKDSIPSPGDCTDEYNVTRTWTVSDGAGSMTGEQLIRVKDTTNPQILAPLPDPIIYLTYNVSTDEIVYPSLETALNYSDNCIETTIECPEMTLVDGNITINFTMYRSCCVKDACDNMACFEQHIQVNDTTPSQIKPPYECPDVIPNVTWPMDSIRNNFMQTINYVANVSCPSDFLLDRLYESWSEDGSYVIMEQLFNYLDVAGTEISVEDFANSTINVSCGAIPMVNISADFFKTICDITLFVNTSDTYYDATPEQVENDGIVRILVREFLAWDSCGATANLTRTYNIMDGAPPQIFNVTTGNQFFHAGTEIPDPPEAYAGDDCGSVKPVFEETFVAGNCSHNFTITRVWTTTDLVGNTDVVTQELEGADVTPPTISPMPSNLTTTADNIPIAPVVNATDDMDGVVTAYYTQEILEEGCYVHPNCSEVNYTIHRNWWSIDECGNEMDINIYIDIVPPTPPPELTIPPNMTIECDQLLTYDSAQSIADDLALLYNATVTFDVQNVPGDCPNEFTIIQTYEATFPDNRVSSGSRYISVVDTTGPVFDPNTPTAIILECGNGMDVDTIVVTDNCYNETEDGPDGIILYLASEVELPSNTTTQYLVRTYVAVDECGNTASFVQYVTIMDTQPPYFTDPLPGNISWPCDANGLPLFPDIGGDDVCSDELYLDAYENITEYGCGPEYTVVRTWRYTDLSGLSVMHQQTISVEDNESPQFVDIPEDDYTGCDDIPDFANVQALDNCDPSVGVTYSQVVHDPHPHNHTFEIHRTWYTQDLCGNPNTTTQIIYVTDYDDPIMTGSFQDIELECALDLPDPYNATAYDDCWGDTNVTFVVNIVSMGLCLDQIVYNRTWTATDRAGLTTSRSQKVTINDIKSPSILGLPAVNPNIQVVECGFLPDPATYYAIDDCWGDPYNGDGSFVPVNKSESIVTPPGKTYEQFINRTWFADDGCGNNASYMEMYHIVDTMAPFIAPKVNSTYDCLSIPDMEDRNGTDLCEGVIVANNTETVLYADCPLVEIIHRTWTVTDEQGNFYLSEEFVHVTDVVGGELPIWNLPLPPAQLTVGNMSDIPTMESYGVSGNDSCFDVTVTFSNSSDTLNCSASFTMNRTWHLTDDCGYTTNFTQTVHVLDGGVPVFDSYPANYTVKCPSEMTPTVNVTAYKNNEALVTNHTITKTPLYLTSCPDEEFVIVNTWRAADCAGALVEHSQYIYVGGAPAPTFTNNTLEPDFVHQCNTTLNFTDLEATSYCGDSLNVTKVEHPVYQNTTQTGNASYVHTMMRSYTTTDDCGRIAYFAQHVHVHDTLPPEIHNYQNYTLYCYDHIPGTNVIASDLCDPDFQLSVETITLPTSCNDNVANRTITAYDKYGNSVELTEFITVDITAPFLNHSILNDTIFVECGDIPMPPPVQVNYPCDPSLNGPAGFDQHVYDVNGTEVFHPTLDLGDVTLDLNIIMAGHLGNGTTIVREWNATNDCGYTATFNQTLLIRDTQPPVWDNLPPYNTTMAECDNIPKQLNLTAYDECTGNATVTISFNQSFSQGSCADEYNITDEYTATDENGLTSVYTNTLVVTDTIGPQITLSHGNDSAYCVPPPPPNGTATDKCVLQPFAATMTSEIVQLGNGSDYQIWRTFWATDECGNPSSVLQITTVYDDRAPVADVEPTNHSGVEAIGLFPPAVLIEGVDYSDCPQRNFSVSTNVTRIVHGCIYNFTYIITTTAVDSNNHTTVTNQYIEVQDTTPPSFVNLPPIMNQTLEFQADWTWADGHLLGEAADDVYAHDSLGETLNATWSDTITDPNGTVISLTEALAAHEFTITRVFTAVDLCGNPVTATQIITVIDTTPPTPNIFPGAATFECDAIPPPCTIHTIGEAFNVSSDSEYIDATTIKNTFWVVDQAGNWWNHTQYIYIQDTTPPVFSELPSNSQHECLCDDVAPVITATDNCGNVGAVNVTSATVYHNPLKPSDHQITSTYHVVDAAGLWAEHSVVQTVMDTKGPTLFAHPDFSTEITGECVAPAAVPAFAHDECEGTLNVTMAQSVVSMSCPHTFVMNRTWTASDGNGNSKSRSRTIVVADLQAPFAGPASNLAQCAFMKNTDVLGEWAEFPDVLRNFDFTDNCASNPTLTVMGCNSTEAAAVSNDFDANCKVLMDPVSSKYSLFVRAATDADTTNRVYSLMVQGTDQCNYSTVEKMTITVPSSNTAWVDFGKTCKSPTMDTLPAWTSV
jgi:hypothetical protein